MLEKVLVPIRKSSPLEKIFAYVIRFANKFDMEVVLLHAYTLSPELVGVDQKSNSYLAEIKKELVEDHNSFLKEAKNNVQKHKVCVTSILKEGKPGPIIIKTLEREKCDLIVMGSRAIGFGRFTFWGVSNYIFRHAKCPIFFIT